MGSPHIPEGTGALWSWDFFSQLCFQVQALLGGKVENIACGSAPVSAKCLNFIRIALACKVYEGEYCFRHIYASCQ